MTVQELIKKLEAVEDKGRDVYVWVSTGGITGSIKATKVDDAENHPELIYIDAVER